MYIYTFKTVRRCTFQHLWENFRNPLRMELTIESKHFYFFYQYAFLVIGLVLRSNVWK